MQFRRVFKDGEIGKLIGGGISESRTEEFYVIVRIAYKHFH